MAKTSLPDKKCCHCGFVLAIWPSNLPFESAECSYKNGRWLTKGTPPFGTVINVPKELSLISVEMRSGFVSLKYSGIYMADES